MNIQVEEKSAHATVYSALVNHLCHQDRLAWSHVPLMIVAQSLMLPAAWALRHTPASYVLILLLLALMFVALGLYQKLCSDRDINLKLMDALTTGILADNLKQERWKNRYGAYVSYDNGDWKWEPLGCTLRARQIMLIGFWLLVSLDVLLLATVVVDPSLLDTNPKCP